MFFWIWRIKDCNSKNYKKNLKSKVNIIDEGFYSTKLFHGFKQRFYFEKIFNFDLKNLKLLYQKKLRINKKYFKFSKKTKS